MEVYLGLLVSGLYFVAGFMVARSRYRGRRVCPWEDVGCWCARPEDDQIDEGEQEMDGVDERTDIDDRTGA